MNLQITSEKDSRLLSRKELTAQMSFSDKTPSKKEIMAELVRKYDVSEDQIRINKIDNKVGHKEALLDAFIYDSKEDFDRITKIGKKEKEKAEKLKKEEEKQAQKQKEEAEKKAEEKKQEKAEDKPEEKKPDEKSEEKEAKGE